MRCTTNKSHNAPKCVSNFAKMSHYYHPRIRKVMRSVACVFARVCLSCSCSNFWKLWSTNSILVCRYTFGLLRLSQVRISRSSGQGQRHSSKKVIRGHTSVTRYTHSRVVVRLRLEGNLVAYTFCISLFSSPSQTSTHRSTMSHY